jgi:hypothetical protein
MTEPESPVPVEQWMKALPADQVVRVCTCRGQEEQQRRRWARIALFKPMALREMRRRYDKYEAEMVPAEKELYQKTIESFENGTFTAIRFNYNIKPFYIPWSPLLWTFLVFICHCNIFITTKILLNALFFALKMKDNPNAWSYWYTAILLLTLLPIFIFSDIFLFILVVPPLAVLLPIVELFLFLCGLIFCGGKYREFGFFRSAITVRLVMADCAEIKRYIAGERYGWLVDTEVEKYSGTVTHLPLKRIFHGGPLQKIFTDMDARYFGFDSIEGQQVMAEDVKRFNILASVVQLNAARPW